MKVIVYRGGVVTFRVPAHWREEYSDTDGGMFYGDYPDSGTLRLKVSTMTAPKPLQSGSATDVLQVVADGLKNHGVKVTTKGRKDGNAVLKYEEAAVEQDMRLTICYWVVANPLPPRHARVATFSYTILAERRNKRQIQRELEMLEAEIEAATFSPDRGVVAG